MILSLSREKWADLISSRPPLEFKKRPRMNSSSLVQTMAKNSSGNLTPKRQNFLTTHNKIQTALEKTKKPGENSEKKPQRPSFSDKNSEETTIETKMLKRGKKTDKGNQTEQKFEFPGSKVEGLARDNPWFSRLNPANLIPDALGLKGNSFHYEKPRLNAEKILREYMNGVNNSSKLPNNALEKINDSLYIENLCNIQESPQTYEIKALKINPETASALDLRKKVINLYNDSDIPYTFPDKLPGNTNQPKVFERKIWAVIRIQKVARGYIARKKLTQEIPKPVNLGKGILQKALEEWDFEETVDFNSTFAKKPLKNQNDLETTVKPVYKNLFETNDGFSVIDLFLKENPKKTIMFSTPSPPLKPSLPTLKHKDSFKSGGDVRQKSTDSHLNAQKEFQPQSSIEEYNEIFEDLTPSQSFLKKSQSNIKESIVKESIEEENFEEDHIPFKKMQSFKESAINESIAEESLQEEIIEESVIKSHTKLQETSYNYEEEKFESISEEKSLRVKREDSSLEESGLKRSVSFKKEKEMAPNFTTPKAKSPSIILKKTVNFSAEDDHDHPLRVVGDKKEPSNLKTTENPSIFPKEHIKENSFKEIPFIQESHKGKNCEILIDSSSQESMGNLMDRARSGIDAFSKHDGELAQLKSELFNVFDDLRHFPSFFNQNKFPRQPTIPSENGNTNGENLYNKFKSEFSRLLNLRTANEYLEVYHKIDDQTRFKKLVHQDLNPGKTEPTNWENLQIEINNMKNKQDATFNTLVSLFHNKSTGEDLKAEVSQMKEQQIELMKIISLQNEKIEELLRRPATQFISERSQFLLAGTPGLPGKPFSVSDKSPVLTDKSPVLTPILTDKSPFLFDKSPISADKSSLPRKDPGNKDLNISESIDIIPEHSKFMETSAEKPKTIISRKETPQKIDKTPEKPVSEEEIEEYIDDFELSTPNLPNVQFQKSFELQKSGISIKSPGQDINLENPNSIEQIKSLSYISSDREIDLGQEISGVSWHLIEPIQPNSGQKTAEKKNSKEIIVDNLTEFITENILEEIIEKGRLFPQRNKSEVEKLLAFLEKKEKKRPESLQLSLPKQGWNMENFEEKSPTKMKKRLKSSTDDLFMGSLEMSVRNEEFITETEKSVRALESKLKRRNNQEKIENAFSQLFEDTYSKINLFTDQDIKEKGPIIVDAFNEQLKMNIIKEINEKRKKEPYFGELTHILGPATVTKNFQKICENSKKQLLKNAQNQLKENEEYLNLKENVRIFDFNRLYQYCRKEKYPLEEEENLEMLEFEINKDWEEFKHECVDDVIDECVKDVIQEMSRLENKKQPIKKK